MCQLQEFHSPCVACTGVPMSAGAGSCLCRSLVLLSLAVGLAVPRAKSPLCCSLGESCFPRSYSHSQNVISRHAQAFCPTQGCISHTPQSTVCVCTRDTSVQHFSKRWYLVPCCSSVHVSLWFMMIVNKGMCYIFGNLPFCRRIKDFNFKNPCSSAFVVVLWVWL